MAGDGWMSQSGTSQRSIPSHGETQCRKGCWQHAGGLDVSFPDDFDFLHICQTQPQSVASFKPVSCTRKAQSMQRTSLDDNQQHLCLGDTEKGSHRRVYCDAPFKVAEM